MSQTSSPNLQSTNNTKQSASNIDGCSPVSILSNRALALKPSPTLALNQKAKELKDKGMDVVSLSIGEPDWSMCDEAAQGVSEALAKGLTKYTVATGIPELKKAIAERTTEQVGVAYTAKDVVVGTGAKYILYGLFQVLLNDGDEVIIPTPYWVSYPAMVELAGGVSVIVETQEKNRFKLKKAELQAKVTAKTKILLLCSPNNPTGLYYSTEELQEIASFLKENPNVLLVSDDIYNRLVFSNELAAPHILQTYPELKNQVIIVNGASKAYAMTGLRVGWALGEAKIMTALGDLISQSTSNLCSLSQYAALKALQHGEASIKSARQILISRKKICLDLFKSISNFEVMEPDGAFYFWISVSKCFGKTYKGQKIESSKQISEILLVDFLVAMVPGLEFGVDSYIRMSIASSEKDLTKAIARIAEFDKALV